MYNYRKQTPQQKAEILYQRQANSFPLHEPPHFRLAKGWFLITAATYEHKQYFHTEAEQAWLFAELQKELQIVNIRISGWVVLPNHYHLLVKCQPLSIISRPLRKVHARTARELNRRDGLIGRKIWHLFSNRQIRNERHYYTTLNYIHYNPTKHDYVRKPSNWTCSSVHWYEKHFGIEWLRELWQTYPIRDYGKGWDWLSE